MNEEEMREFLLAGQLSVQFLDQETYQRKKNQLQGQSWIQLEQGKLIDIDLLKESIVLNEGSHTCLLGYLKYGTRMWIFHAAPQDISQIAEVISRVMKSIATKGEAYLDVFGHSPLSEEVLKALGATYDPASQREALVVNIETATNQKIKVIYRDHCSTDPHEVTDTFMDSKNKTIYAASEKRIPRK